MAKRKPIDYQPQFGGGIFRPREQVAAELELEATESEESAEPTGEPVTERSNVRTNEGAEPRAKVRHSFDVFTDQIAALNWIQTQRFTRTGKKPKLGELVQEALDAYIMTHDERSSERSNVRTNG